MSAAKIAAIQTLRTAFQNANTSQEGYVRRRPVLTQDRIIVLNNCYNNSMIVVEAAQVIYYNDVARKDQFVFKHSKSQMIVK